MTAGAQIHADRSVASPLSWGERNHEWLVAALARLRDRIQAQRGEPGAWQSRGVEDCLADETTLGFTPALLWCGSEFGLTPFERELLLLAAGVELDQRLRASIAALNNGVPTISFAMALAILTQPHWDALSPDAPLRYWQLVTVDEDGVGAGGTLTRAPIRIDERVLHFITGVAADDTVLSGRARRIDPADIAIGDTDDVLAERVARAFTKKAERSTIVVVHTEAPDSVGLRDVALAAVRRVAQSALWVVASDLPTDGAELVRLGRRVHREGALADALPVLAVDAASSESTAVSFARAMRGPLLWLGAPLPALKALPDDRRIMRFELPAPDAKRTRATLIAHWTQSDATTLERDRTPADVVPELERAAAQFHVGPSEVCDIVERLDSVPSRDRAGLVWAAAREVARGGLDELAQRVEGSARLADLILPAAQLAALRDIAAQLRNRDRVYGDWGFAAKHARGQGMTALFVGESGTGKTLAAEAIANEVELDLYRIDLATVVSKYIGETEKNLKRLFAAAESSGAVLLFDEADALFGKRSEVKDSHDRYANIEVAYLLQRMESYRGLAILTTNMKSALDRAFLRRIRFVLHFPFPDAAAREQIWRRELPTATPVGDIDFSALSRLNLSGGNIHSVVLNAAFKAADGSGRVDHAVLAEAARAEFAKLERTFTEVPPGTGAA